jgi:hypothetical protein
MPLKATNAGLSLSEATHVFLLDTSLNRGLETQALARVRRVDSTQPTTVHRFVTRGTVEDAVWDLLQPAHDAAVAAAAAAAAAAARGGGGAATVGGEDQSGAGRTGSSALVASAARHEVRRCDVHELLTNLRELYCTNAAADEADGGGADGGGAAPRAHRPAWRARLLSELEDLGA